MDIYKRTAEIIKEYHKFKNDSISESEFIKCVCLYFNDVKFDSLNQGELQLLMQLCNDVGLPQYFMMLGKFQKKEIIIEYLTLGFLSATINKGSLYTTNSIILHRFQKEVLEKYMVEQKNRYFLSAPTSFGKTYLVYEIIRKMRYENIMLVFPAISLLSENYDKLLSNEDYVFIKTEYDIHTLSDVEIENDKNIFLFTPERYLSYIDKHPKQRFDFVFIDEIYKIDNDYVIDVDTIGENERDIAYRLALEYACQASEDMLLVGPYIEFTDINRENANLSFNAFIKINQFKVLDYNNYEIVEKKIYEVKDTKQVHLENDELEKFVFGNASKKHERLAVIIQRIFNIRENAIIYCHSKKSAEKYTDSILNYLGSKVSFLDDTEAESIYGAFMTHLEDKYSKDWIIVKALRAGVGIHHGLVPKYIQKEIINLFNKGILKFLFSTTTITEGVNTTAKNIIILSDKKGTKDLKKFDAKNISGRAGRFTQHYVGRVIILKNKFSNALNQDEIGLKHKNYDLNSPKTDIDYFITKDEYLTPKDIESKEIIDKMQDDRGLPDEIVNQFKVISKIDKFKIYDNIQSYDESEKTQVENFIYKIRRGLQFDFQGFESILSSILPIIKNDKLKFLATYKKENVKYVALTYMLHHYLNDGFFSLVRYNVDERDQTIDDAIRYAAEFVYNTLKYELVKYLGVFDILYRYNKSVKLAKDIDDVGGIAMLLQKLEYNALTESGRKASDFGVPFKVVEYYEKEKSQTIKNKFDDYEKYINSKIETLF